MRILLATNHKRNIHSGAAGNIEHLGLELERLGHTVSLLFQGDLTDGHLPPNWDALAPIPLRLAAQIAKLERQSGEFDIVDISSAEGYAYGLWHRLTRRSRTRYVFYSHGLENRGYELLDEQSRLGLEPLTWRFRLGYTGLRLPQERLAMRLADKVIVQCQVDRAFVEERVGIAPERVALVPGGISDQFLRTNASLTDRPRDLIFVGWWGQRKGTRELVEAFTQVARQHPTVRLTIAGSGVSDAAVYSLFPEDIRGRVDHYRFVPHQDLIDLYFQHKIMLFPSLGEGFGKAFLEGMGAGLAVIATNLGGMADVIEHGQTGLLVPPRTSEPMAHWTSWLLNNEIARQEMARRAQVVAHRYNWETIARQTEAVFADLYDRPATRTVFSMNF